MPYEVICPPGTSATVLRSEGEFQDKETGETWHRHKGDVFESGAIIPDENVSPHTVALYDAEDPHVRSMLKRLPKGAKAKAKDDGVVEAAPPAFDPLAEQVERLPRHSARSGG